MAKKGAVLEQLVALIQETLKDRQNTTVQTNVRVVDNTNIRREIDVLVSTVVQGLPYVIAFECKDYSKKSVDIQAVDSFIGKCKYLPCVHRKVMVSSSGFSNNARNRAQAEDIILCSIEELPLDKMFSDTKVYNPIIHIEFCEGIINLSADFKEDLDSIECFDCYLSDGNVFYDFRKETIRRLCEFKTRMLLVSAFLKHGKKPFNVNAKFHFDSSVLYLLNRDEKRVWVDEVIIPVKIDFELETGDVIKQQRLVQGKEVVITENRFENDNRPYNAVIMDAGEKWGAAFKINDQYVKPSMQIEC